MLAAVYSTALQKKFQKQYISVSVTFRQAVTSLSLYGMKAYYAHSIAAEQNIPLFHSFVVTPLCSSE